MKRRLAPVPLVLVAMIATAGAATARPGASARAASKITISSSVPAFHGEVHSGKRVCIDGRRVELLRKRPGRDPRSLGTDRTSGSGRWKIPVGSLRSGAYFAKVAPKSRAGCRGARSETALVD